MLLSHWKRALALGLLSWLAPFVFAILIFPIKRVNAPLFQTVMSAAVVLTAALLAKRYFRDAAGAPVGEASALGFVWLAINLVLDYPMFAYGPMRMTAAHYYSEIGADYLLYPIFLAGAAWIVAKTPRTL